MNDQYRMSDRVNLEVSFSRLQPDRIFKGLEHYITSIAEKSAYLISLMIMVYMQFVWCGRLITNRAQSKLLFV